MRWLWQWFSVVVVALLATAVTVYPPYNNWPPIRSDGAGYHIWNYALLKGDLSFSWYEGDPKEVSLHQPDPAQKRFTCKYPVGVALMRLPVMALVTDSAHNGLPYSRGEHWACLALAAAALVGTVWFSLVACRHAGASALWSHVAVFALTFGTGLFHYGTYDASFSHVFCALAASALVWLVLRSANSGRPVPLVPLVAVVALLLLLRSTNIVLVGAGGLLCVLALRGTANRVRGAAGVTVGVAVGLALTLWVNYQMFGRYTFLTYPGEQFHWDKNFMWSVLVGKKHGAMTFHPVLGVALLVPLLARRSMLLWLVPFVTFGCYVFLYGHWWTWHLADGFGHRGFVDMVPVAIPVLAVALTGLRRWYLAGPFALLALSAAGYTVVRMALYWGLRPVTRPPDWP
jgi:hypothetical protein